MTETNKERHHSHTPKGRLCFGHLGGKLGGLIFQRMIELGWIALEEDKATVYVVSENGRHELEKLGIVLE
jgi:hypothetical protein